MATLVYLISVLTLVPIAIFLKDEKRKKLSIFHALISAIGIMVCNLVRSKAQAGQVVWVILFVFILLHLIVRFIAYLYQKSKQGDSASST